MTNAISLAAVLLAVAAVGRAAETPEEFMDAVLKDLRSETSSIDLDPGHGEPFNFSITQKGERTSFRFDRGLFMGLKSLRRLGRCTYKPLDSRMKLACNVSMNLIGIFMNGEIQEGAAPLGWIYTATRLIGDNTARIEIDGEPGSLAHLQSFTPGSFSLHTDIKYTNHRNLRAPKIMRMVNKAIADQLAWLLERGYKVVLAKAVRKHIMPQRVRRA